MIFRFLLSKILSDLRFENVLISAQGHCKIIGFSNSKIIGFGRDFIVPSSQSIKMSCTPPEFIEASYESMKLIENGHSYDYWSLGVMVYKMFSGHFPFRNEIEIKEKSIPDLTAIGLGKETNDLIHSLLNKNKNERLYSILNGHDIKESAFFAGIDWLNLEKMQPSFVPVFVN